MVWIQILLKIVDEGTLKPLYHCLGQSVGDIAATRNKVKSGFLALTILYAVFSALTRKRQSA